MMMKETDIAAAVIRYFQDRDEGWEIFQEVKCGISIADIVARRGRLLWVVECKVGGFLAVLGQAERWLCHANFVSIAMPGSTRTATMRRVMEPFGIGFIGVRSGYAHSEAFPKLNRRLFPELGKALHDDQKTFCPAGSKHGYWSPFKNTCAEVKKYVHNNPGCSMKDMANGIRHHYGNDAAAIASLRGWLRDTNQIPGVRYEARGRFIVLNPSITPDHSGLNSTEPKG